MNVLFDVEEVFCEKVEGLGDLGGEFCRIGFGAEVVVVVDEVVFGVEGEGGLEVWERVLVGAGFGDGAEVVGLGIKGVGFEVLVEEG